MAQRLATEYKKVSLTLKKGQLTDFIRLFREMNARIEEKVLDNGDYEITLYDYNDQVRLTFENHGEYYFLCGHCLFKDRNLAETMRKAMTAFKGEAVVDRIFSSFKVEYRYEHGTIQSIREINDKEERLIYTNTDFSIQLQKIFANDEVEREIMQIKEKIDFLLDQRLEKNDHLNLDHIDRRLSKYVKRLKQLEV